MLLPRTSVSSNRRALLDGSVDLALGALAIAVPAASANENTETATQYNYTYFYDWFPPAPPVVQEASSVSVERIPNTSIRWPDNYRTGTMR